MLASRDLILGVVGLDELVGPIRSPYVLLIAGNPGAGKTTLASTICYRNALSGRKCLFLTFYEHREKMFEYMSELGIDLAGLESRQLLRFSRIPVSSSVDAVTEALTSLVSGDRYSVVVIDSINPILEVMEIQARRAWLTNFFYNLAQNINGLVVLVTELPYGAETVESGVLEFIADAVLVLKQKIEDKFLVRYLEVRKARGSPVSLAEVPFSIGKGAGVRLWVPSLISEVASEGEPVEFPCESLRRFFGALRRGQVINVFYPPDGRHPGLAALAWLVAAINRMRTLVISYKYPPHVIEDILANYVARFGIDKEVFKKLFGEYFKVVSINPFSYSTSQLAIREMETVNTENPDMVVFHGPEIAEVVTDFKTYVRELFNEINYLKNRGIIVMRLVSYIDETSYRIESSIADAVVKLEYVKTPSGLEWAAYLWAKGREPHMIPVSQIEKCMGEAVDFLKTTLEKGVFGESLERH